MTIAQDKAALRETAAHRRLELADAAGGEAPGRLLPLLRERIVLHAGLRVSAFWPVRGEIDTRPLLEGLHALGVTCLLPVVEGRERPLIFRRWTQGMAMDKASFNIPVPPPDSPQDTPDLLLVPLLAFDDAGYRLGYGGGFYDRTLAALRASTSSPPLALGVAYAGQRLDGLPRDQFDQPLDGILTEMDLMIMNGGTNAHPLLR